MDVPARTTRRGCGLRRVPYECGVSRAGTVAGRAVSRRPAAPSAAAHSERYTSHQRCTRRSRSVRCDAVLYDAEARANESALHGPRPDRLVSLERRLRLRDAENVFVEITKIDDTFDRKVPLELSEDLSTCPGTAAAVVTPQQPRDPTSIVPHRIHEDET